MGMTLSTAPLASLVAIQMQEKPSPYCAIRKQRPSAPQQGHITPSNLPKSVT